MELVSVDFKSSKIEVVEDSQSIVIKDICKNIGLNDYQGQQRKLKSDSTYCSKLIKVKTAGGIQEVFTIPLSKLNGWLFSINPNKVKPEVKEKLIEYKNECFDVLHQHFYKQIAEPQNININLLMENVQSLLTENTKLNDEIKQLKSSKQITPSTHNNILDSISHLFRFQEETKLMINSLVDRKQSLDSLIKSFENNYPRSTKHIDKLENQVENSSIRLNLELKR